MCNCGNNKNRLGSNFGGVIDLNIPYTGCGKLCNGVEIPKDSSIRDVLDILIGNCDQGGGTGSKWYYGNGVPTFPANDGDFYLQASGEVWEYDLVQGWEQTDINLKSVSWGSITGNIQLQEDLIELIESITVDLSQSAGQGLSYDQTEDKIQLGDTSVIPNFRIIKFKDTDISVVLAYGSSDTEVPIDVQKAKIFINPNGVELSSGQDMAGINIEQEKITIKESGSTLELSEAGIVSNGNLLSFQAAVSITLRSGGNMQFETGVGSTIIMNGDVRVNSGKNFILLSPNGTKHALRVSDAGALSTVIIP